MDKNYVFCFGKEFDFVFFDKSIEGVCFIFEYCVVVEQVDDVWWFFKCVEYDGYLFVIFFVQMRYGFIVGIIEIEVLESFGVEDVEIGVVFRRYVDMFFW